MAAGPARQAAARRLVEVPRTESTAPPRRRRRPRAAGRRRRRRRPGASAAVAARASRRGCSAPARVRRSSGRSPSLASAVQMLVEQQAARDRDWPGETSRMDMVHDAPSRARRRRGRPGSTSEPPVPGRLGRARPRRHAAAASPRSCSTRPGFRRHAKKVWARLRSASRTSTWRASPMRPITRRPVRKRKSAAAARGMRALRSGIVASYHRRHEAARSETAGPSQAAASARLIQVGHRISAGAGARDAGHAATGAGPGEASSSG